MLGAGDVVGSWAGLRPLLRSAEDEKTADLSRHHRVTRSPSGMVTIAGGKLTTYRRMADDTVDEVVRGLGLERRCATKSLPLHGAGSRQSVDDVLARRTRARLSPVTPRRQPPRSSLP